MVDTELMVMVGGEGMAGELLHCREAGSPGGTSRSM